MSAQGGRWREERGRLEQTWRERGCGGDRSPGCLPCLRPCGSGLLVASSPWRSREPDARGPSGSGRLPERLSASARASLLLAAAVGCVPCARQVLDAGKRGATLSNTAAPHPPPTWSSGPAEAGPHVGPRWLPPDPPASAGPRRGHGAWCPELGFGVRAGRVCPSLCALGQVLPLESPSPPSVRETDPRAAGGGQAVGAWSGGSGPVLRKALREAQASVRHPCPEATPPFIRADENAPHVTGGHAESWTTRCISRFRHPRAPPPGCPHAPGAQRAGRPRGGPLSCCFRGASRLSELQGLPAGGERRPCRGEAPGSRVSVAVVTAAVVRYPLPYKWAAFV